MPVELKGSCHCGAVAFTVQSSTPVPYQLCMCSICRKVGGAGGSINLGAHADTLQITKGKGDISYANDFPIFYFWQWLTTHRVCDDGWGGQDIQSCVGPGHAAGKAGIVGEALLLKVLSDALAMG